MEIGFIGLGNLGSPIAENVLQKKRRLFVFNRTASKTEHLVEKGAIRCTGIKELAQKCDIVFSVVSDDGALNDITKGDNGIAHNLKEGGVHISVSTILPATAKELTQVHKQFNNHYIAAPVMGRPEAARAGKLNFLVAGEAKIIETIKPLLQDAGGIGIWEFGNETQAANVAKLCTNFLIVSAIESMAEGINLAKKSGVDSTAWINMITQTLFAAPVYINYSNILLKEMFQPAGFALKLGLKDANLVMSQSNEVKAEMPIGKLMQERLYECVENGLGDHDWTALALALK
ncbi:MAG TPA: NAD(P)-dependent oxidoreductase [Chitinophagaceae bacterium]|jgi:3-hydroxyisobutyrate dehydrogenase-like beta-hydroxyacid dehydrogenase|nr:NAD(P)-dependent oxidoreductase [Chitinophagaceae bacterium]